jgi:hypothetical protein
MRIAAAYNLQEFLSPHGGKYRSKTCRLAYRIDCYNARCNTATEDFANNATL